MAYSNNVAKNTKTQTVKFHYRLSYTQSSEDC